MRNVLISGAGVAGPALAYWLARHGMHATVVERAPTLRQGGQAVDFRGTAQLRVLDLMGLLPAIRSAQTAMGPITIVNERGRRLSTIPAEAFSGEVEILRGDLSHILYEATSDTTEYLFGDSITSLTDTGSGVHATFERNAPGTYDLVIGADGTRSNVRRLAFGEHEGRHMGFYGAIFTAPNTYGLHRRGLMYSVPGRSATILGFDDTAKVMLDFAAPRPTETGVEEAFEGLGWHVPELLEAMRQAPDHYLDAATQIVMDRYSTGRVALLGDAGYGPGPGGMGTGLAVVGAYVLAGELAATTDHRAAFADYERRMRPYAEACAKHARGGERFLVPSKRSQIWTRNQIMRLLSHLPAKKLTIKAADAVTLPEYGVTAPKRRL